MVTVRALPTVSVRGLVADCGVGEVESDTWTVKVNEPLELGVPDNTPLMVSVTPLGKDPEESDQL